MRSPRLRMSPHMARAEGQAPGSIPDRIVRPRPRTTVLLPPHLVSPSIGRRRGRDRGPAATHRSGQGSALDPSGLCPESRQGSALDPSGVDPPPRTDLARTMTWPRRGSTPNPARFFIKKRGKKFWERSMRFAHGKNMLPDTGENGTMVTGTLIPIGTLYREEEGRPHGRGF